MITLPLRSRWPLPSVLCPLAAVGEQLRYGQVQRPPEILPARLTPRTNRVVTLPETKNYTLTFAHPSLLAVLWSHSQRHFFRSEPHPRKFLPKVRRTHSTGQQFFGLNCVGGRSGVVNRGLSLFRGHILT